MFNQGSLPLNDYREKYSILVQVLLSYDIKLYEREKLKDRINAKYSSLMWHGFIDQFAKDNPKELKEEENILHEETTAYAFLANSNKHKYSHIIAELPYDYLKGNNHYPGDVNAMYKLLDEYSNDEKAIDHNASGAPHLTFSQGSTGKYQSNRQLKCHKCGLANYTVYTCPNCNKDTFHNGKPQNYNWDKQVKLQKGILKDKKSRRAFAKRLRVLIKRNPMV